MMTRISRIATIVFFLFSPVQGLMAANQLNETELENLVAPVAL